jgi:hypothetical protein
MEEPSSDFDYSDEEAKQDTAIAEQAYASLVEAVEGRDATGATYALWIQLIYCLVWSGWNLGDLTRDLVYHVDEATKSEAETTDDVCASPHCPGHA